MLGYGVGGRYSRSDALRWIQQNRLLHIQGCNVARSCVRWIISQTAALRKVSEDQNE